jgi:ATP-dependent DNA ligase
LYFMLENITTNGGEGVILRKKGSLYEHGRSPSLLKFKVSTLSLE